MRILIYAVPFNVPSLSVWVGPSLVSVFTNVLLLSGWAQVCFPVLTNAPCLLCLPEGPNSYVLTNAPRLFVSVWIGPKSVFCAHQCTTSACVCLEGPIWFVLTNAPLLSFGAQICFLCSLMHHVFLCLPGGSQLVLCSPMHHLFLCLFRLARVCLCAH